MPNPWVSVRCAQLIPVNKAVNKKEQLEKGLEEEEEEEKKYRWQLSVSYQSTNSWSILAAEPYLKPALI
jgi:hypothetical protein